MTYWYHQPFHLIINTFIMETLTVTLVLKFYLHPPVQTVKHYAMLFVCVCVCVCVVVVVVVAYTTGMRALHCWI